MVLQLNAMSVAEVVDKLAIDSGIFKRLVQQVETDCMKHWPGYRIV